VEGPHPDAGGAELKERLQAAAHLTRGLVGEGHGQDLVREGALGADQVGDPVREHTRLAAARAGEDQ
jgi:hypothetical protein